MLYLLLGSCYCLTSWDLLNPQSGHGVYTTPIDFYLIKKGSLHLSGIRFFDFSYIIYIYTHKKMGLIK